MKKFLSIVLALVLVLSLCASAMAETFTGPMITEPAWDEPVIAADLVTYMRSYQGVWTDIWWWDFCEAYFKIDFEVTQTTSPSDYKSIAFMGGSMPDVFYQLYMGNAAQVEHGEVNGYLLNLEPYITPELMPNLTKIFDSNPNYKVFLQTQLGEIYSLGAFNNSNATNMSFFINNKWLQDAGLEVPATLDEFEVALAAFKKRGDDVVPMGGDLGNSPRYLANAMGWVINAAGYLTAPALRLGDDGLYHAEYIYGNEDLFPVFMTKMKEWIDAGYFSPNLFSSQVAGDESNALKAQDKVGFEQNVSNVLKKEDWIAAKFLTSEWNAAPQVGRTYNAQNNQSFNLAANILEEVDGEAKVERLMKWCDWHYTYDHYQISHQGPAASDTEWLLGLQSGWTATKGDDGRWTWTCAEMTTEGGSFGDYQNKHVQGIIGSYVGLGYDMFGDAIVPINPSKYDHKEDEHHLTAIVDPFPQSYFLDADTTITQSSLSAPINTWVNEKYSAFISGTEEMSEENIENFYAKLYELGFEEYRDIIVDYYEAAFNG